MTENDESILQEEANRKKSQEINPLINSLPKAFDMAKYVQNKLYKGLRTYFEVNIETNQSQLVLKNNDYKKQTKSLKIMNIPINVRRMRRNVQLNMVDFIKNEATSEAYYEDDYKEGLIDKEARDYLFDETYEDEDSVNDSRFGSFQKLFQQAEKNRIRKEREETKLNKNQ